MTTPPAQTFTPPPAPPKKTRWGLIIGIVVAAVVAIIVVIVVVAVLLVNGTTKDAQKVSDQFVTAVQAGDGAKAYALTGPAFRAATTQEQLDELVTNLSKLVTKEKVSPSGKAINASTSNGKIAVFTYTLKGSGGGNVYFKTQIRDEDGGWQVMNFRSSETKLDTEVE
jgi:hypothetical protein